MDLRDENETKSDAWLIIEELERQNERQSKRMFAALITVIVLWFCTTVGFVLYLYQYDFTNTTVTVDSGENGGPANYLEGDGSITNGESDSAQAGQN